MQELQAKVLKDRVGGVRPGQYCPIIGDRPLDPCTLLAGPVPTVTMMMRLMKTTDSEHGNISQLISYIS